MSQLVVEVCRVETVERHPNADRLAIATVKGWKACIAFDPATGRAEFKEGDLCVYFPPDSVLPPALANGPHKVCKARGCELFNKPATAGTCPKCGGEVSYKHGTPGRTGAMDYCAELPMDEVTNARPPGGRVKAARLRGVQSFGFILKIDPAKGDDPSWTEGTDVKEHFGVTKWEPPLDSDEGDAAPAHPRFHGYTDIEHWANFPTVIPDGEEVIVTEKIHGKNARIGLVLDTDDAGQAQWVFMAGSHGVNRKEFAGIVCRFKASELTAGNAITAGLAPGDTFTYRGETWRAIELRPREDEVHIRAEMLGTDGAPKLRKSQFWTVMTDDMRALLTHIRDNFPWREPKTGIVVFGEMFGSGVQDMTYGLRNGHVGVRIFDIAINHEYVNFDDKAALCARFGIPMVPVIYRGPFSAKVIDDHTSGPTTVCRPEEAGAFKGREGIVITPAVERVSEAMLATGTNGRVILKSVSADYLARKGGTDSH